MVNLWEKGEEFLTEAELPAVSILINTKGRREGLDKALASALRIRESRRGPRGFDSGASS